MDEKEIRTKWSWKKRMLYLLVGIVLVWIVGDFGYSRVIAWRVSKWEETIQRDEDGVMIDAAAYSSGDGDAAILFIHGINDTPHIWRNMVPEFVKAGYSCRVMRLPGFGESTEQYASSDRQEWLAELDREFKSLKKDHDRIYIVAHSLGGAIAINWTLENQQNVDGLLLLAPVIAVSSDRSPLLSTRAWHEIGDRLLMFTRITETPFTADAHDPDQREYDDRIRFVGRNTATESFTLIDANQNRAADLTLPIFLALGVHDHVIDNDAAKHFLESAESEVKSIQMFDESAHAMQVDYDWRAVTTEMLTFLQTLQSGDTISGDATSGESSGSAKKTKQQAAIERLEKVGGVVTFQENAEETRVPVSLMFAESRRIQPENVADIATLTTLTELNLNDQPFLDDEMLEQISTLKKLQTLNIMGTAITDMGMRRLKSLKELRTLYVWRTEIGNHGLEPLLELPKLQFLNLFDVPITDDGIHTLMKMKQLRQLKLGNSHSGGFGKSQISQSAIKRLRAVLPDTEIVFWTDSDRPEAPTRILNDRVHSTVDSGNDDARNKLPANSKAPANLSARTIGDDWSSFLGPTADSKSNEAGILTNWDSNPPKIVWDQVLGEGYSAPAISRGRAFIYHRIANPKHDQPNESETESDASPFVEQLLCLHSETGDCLWSVDFPTHYTDTNGYGDGPRSTPVVDQNRVYILSPAGDLRCMRAIDGEKIWSLNLDEEYQRTPDFFGVGTTPVIEDDLLFVIAGGSKKALLESGVVALDKFTGEFRYGVSKQMASYASPKFATIDGRRWCFAFARDGLLAFDPEDGRIDFEYPWQAKVSGCVNAAMPVVEGNEVLITEAYRLGSSLLSVSPGNFEVVWADEKRSREKAMESHWATPIFHEGFVYGCSGRHANESELRCINWKSGEVQWSEKVYDRCSLLYVDDHFVCLGENGSLTLFEANPNEYKLAGTMKLDKHASHSIRYPAWAAPVLSHGLLYVRGKDRIVCLELIPE